MIPFRWSLPSDLLLHSATRSACVAVLIAGLVLSSCDLLPTSSSGQAGSQRLRIALLESGRVVTDIPGTGPLRTQMVEGLRVQMREGARAKMSSEAEGSVFAHKHACTISLYRPEGPSGPGYYVRSAELAYSDSTLRAAEGETKRLKARLWAAAVPRPSETNALLRCRLPAVEGAERRVRRFFRAGPEQLNASGFEKVDSAGTGSGEATESTKATENAEATERGTRAGAAGTATAGKAAVGSSCWRERVCLKNDDGDVYDCTEWRERGSCSGGVGIGGLPGGGGDPSLGTELGGGAEPQKQTLDPTDIDGGPLPVPMPQQPDPGFDPDPTDENEVCSNDPLKDMDIRSTCDGIEGGRFGEDARGDGEPHWGIDLLADVGTKVTARGGGVVWSKNQNDTFGRYIIVQSEDGGTFTMYAHLSSRSVEGGDSVVAGETEIGETGTSGNACDTSCSCGPAHLHLEMRQGGDGWGDSTPVDPENHLGTEFEDSTGQPTSDSC